MNFIEKKINSKAKSNLTLYLDKSILESIKRDAKIQGISVNARINHLLNKYVFFYRHVEEYESAVMLAKVFSVMLSDIDEQKLIDMITQLSVEVLQSIFAHNNIPITTENVIKYTFESIGLWAGMYSSFTYYNDKMDILTLVFEHKFGPKWSRVMGESFSNYIQVMLKIKAEIQYASNTVSLRIDDR